MTAVLAGLLVIGAFVLVLAPPAATVPDTDGPSERTPTVANPAHTPTNAGNDAEDTLAAASSPPADLTQPRPTHSLTFTPSRTAAPEDTLDVSAATPHVTALATVRPTRVPVHSPADGPPTRIQAEIIDLDAPVVTVDTREITVDGDTVLVWEVADYAAGFHQGSALPGHVGNTVITGHNNTAGEVFRELHRLALGDAVVLWVSDTPYKYEVSAIHRIPFNDTEPDRLDDALRWIAPTNDQRLTLVTCWPYWSNTHRTIVVAFPVPM